MSDHVWRKSSHSGSQAQECVEVATAWRKSSRSGSQFQECVEVTSAWRKSSRSGSHLEECVEVARVARVVAVRDSKDPDGPVLAIDAQAWQCFLDSVKAREASASAQQ